MKSCPKHGYLNTSPDAEGCPVCRIYGEGSPMQVEEANRRYFNPARWELEQLMQIITRYQAAARNLLLARYRDGECDAVALSTFESEINEISEDLQKTEISL